MQDFSSIIHNYESHKSHDIKRKKAREQLNWCMEYTVNAQDFFGVQRINFGSLSLYSLYNIFKILLLLGSQAGAHFVGTDDTNLTLSHFSLIIANVIFLSV